MSGLFRSEDMTYVRLIMSTDAAYDTVRQLGRFKKLHIVDLVEAAQAAQHASGAPAVATTTESNFTVNKKRVALSQFWERKMLTFGESFKQYKIAVPDPLDPLEVEIQDIRSADIIEDCRTFLEPLEADFTKNVLFRRHQQQQMNEYLEYLQVLQFNAGNRFASVEGPQGAEHGYQSSEGFALLNEDDVMEAGGRSSARSGVSRFTSTLCGVIPTDRTVAFERLLFRVSRGNAFCHLFDLPEPLTDPATGEKVNKQVFAVTFMGDQLARRIGRIVQSSGGTEYPVPGSPHEIERLERDIRSKLDDAATLLRRTDDEIRHLLSSLAIDPESHSMPYRSPYFNWLTALQQERRICNVLRQCDQDGPHSKMLTLEGWCPSNDIEELRFNLAQAVRATQAKQAVLQTFPRAPNHTPPPTYFKTNVFTSSFQGIVDTYGVCRYKEINPGLFTIISFPFLFGVMYGDIGHGSIIFLFALWMLWNERKFMDLARRGELGEIPRMVFGGRYLLVMMGFFALYAGTIYNDLFSNPVHVFTSRWSEEVVNITSIDSSSNVTEWSLQNVTLFAGEPYPYGVDPGWYHTKNELAFFNSMKMKLAVTLGVTQMTFGICLSALNEIYFKDYLAVYFEFLPRLVFILSTFGYMVFIIIFKMCSVWGEGTTPPLLIQTMIQMFLSPGSVKEENILYSGQGTIQAILLLLAVFSVPFMLFAVPCITNQRNKAFMKKLSGRSSSRSVAGGGGHYQEIQLHAIGPSIDEAESGFGVRSSSRGTLEESLINSSTPSSYGVHTSHSAEIIDDRESKESDHFDHVDDSDDEHGGGGGGHGEHALGPDYSYGDHLIVNGIHTIEFVLGTVSNTASYLRLWALSLAHAELSAVFWDKMIMQYGINGSNPFSAVMGFAVWAVATFAVLLAMDTLECFLHALRLHWVEFQNKFFKADGYAFQPFTFEDLGEDANAA